jgi:hypothetical protein
VARHELPGEGLAGLETRHRPGGPEDGHTGLPQQVGHTVGEGILGTDHDQVDALVSGEADQTLGVTGLDPWNQGGLRRHPGVAGSRVDPFDKGAPRDLPDQRVLSPPRTCDKHTHRLGASSCLTCELRSPLGSLRARLGFT